MGEERDSYLQKGDDALWILVIESREGVGDDRSISWFVDEHADDDPFKEEAVSGSGLDREDPEKRRETSLEFGRVLEFGQDQQHDL